MNGGDWLCPGNSWRLAFLLSAVLHAAVVAGLAWMPLSRPQTSAEDHYPLITVCEVRDDPSGGGSSMHFFPRAGDGADSSTSSGHKTITSDALPAEMQPFIPELIRPEAPTANTEPAPHGPAGHPAAVGAGHGHGAGIGPGQGNGQGGTSFFKVPARGQRIVYVIDRSSSMGRHGALNIARQELLASVHALPADARFQIIVYNSTAQPLIEEEPGWLAATTDNKLRVARELAALEATHGTKHDRALPMALALQPDVIFFLTDADDLDPRHLTTLTARNQGRAAIHVIELNTHNVGRTAAPLQVFARQNRGTYLAVDLSRYP